eukprot:TRINITY_DN66033_c4_g10_i1.p1 TRINITY_DN66033_c4_g10~~TRINITY_DN66033_c4_g10_i1.p1  ORF type:complete len:285 (-),score=138.97 TRINITY_DN66033_c4_g10_i1:64-918(-)
MFSLLSGLWAMLFSKARFQILILGLDNAGKTTLLEQLKCLYGQAPPPKAHKIPPTVGLNIGKLSLATANVVFWDLGGQQSLRVIWDKYYADAHAVMFVVDTTASEKKMYESVRELEGILRHSELAHAPIVLLANKLDLGQHKCMSMDRIHQVFSEVLRGGEPDFALLKREAPSLMQQQQRIQSLSSSTSSKDSNESSRSGGGGGSSISSSSKSKDSDESKTQGSRVGQTRIASVSNNGRPFLIQGMSALSGAGINEAVEWLMETLPRSNRAKHIARAQQQRQDS